MRVPTNRPNRVFQRSVPRAAAVAALLAFALALAPGCGSSSPKQARADAGGKPPSRKPDPVLVEVHPVEVGSIASVYTSTGTLRAERETDVVARVRGIVEEVRFEEGDRVAEGDVLCRLDDKELRISRDRAKATAANAALKFERARRLQGQNLISEEDYQESSHEHELADADADMAELELSYATVRSPISGRIAERRVVKGQEVSEGDPLFRIVDEDPLLLDLFVPERLVARLSPGQPVDLSLDASGLLLQGRISRLSPVVDVATGTVKVVVEVSPKEGVRTGSFTRARVVTDVHEKARIVPRDALVSEGDDWFVFIVEEGKAHKVPVRLGFEDADRVEILEGPQAGDRVVVAGAPALQDESPVEVFDASAPEPEQGTES